MPRTSYVHCMSSVEMTRRPICVLPYSVGVNETMKFVPSCPGGSNTPSFGINSKFIRAVRSELCFQIAISIEMIAKLEADTGCLVHHGLDHNNIVYSWLGCIEHHWIFSASTSRLTDDKINVCSKRFQWIKIELISQWLLWIAEFHAVMAKPLMIYQRLL